MIYRTIQYSVKGHKKYTQLMKIHQNLIEKVNPIEINKKNSISFLQYYRLLIVQKCTPKSFLVQSIRDTNLYR